MTTQNPAKPVVAAFDFDGTLTHRDTLLPFLLYVFGPFRCLVNSVYLLPILAGYAFGFIRNDIAKTKVLRRFLAKMDFSELQIYARNFAELKLPTLLRSDAMERLHWHKQQGHRCILVSASLEIYLRPWASQAGFSDILGSRLETGSDSQRISGNLLGKNCFGPEKLRRLENLLGNRDDYILYAYGDSRGDKELLSAADYPFFRKFTG